MKRLTTDNPQTKAEIKLNYAYADGGQIYLRYGEGEENIDLNEYLAGIADKKRCRPTAEEIRDGACLEGCDCEVAILQTVATQAAELRARLREYENAEETGLLVRLLCKVGDVLYENYNGKTRKRVLREITIGINNTVGLSFGRTLWSGANSIGKTIFGTREEAEKALKEAKE